MYNSIKNEILYLLLCILFSQNVKKKHTKRTFSSYLPTTFLSWFWLLSEPAPMQNKEFSLKIQKKKNKALLFERYKKPNQLIKVADITWWCFHQDPETKICVSGEFTLTSCMRRWLLLLISKNTVNNICISDICLSLSIQKLIDLNKYGGSSA